MSWWSRTREALSMWFHHFARKEQKQPSPFGLNKEIEGKLAGNKVKVTIRNENASADQKIKDKEESGTVEKQLEKQNVAYPFSCQKTDESLVPEVALEADQCHENRDSQLLSDSSIDEEVVPKVVENEELEGIEEISDFPDWMYPSIPLYQWLSRPGSINFILLAEVSQPGSADQLGLDLEAEPMEIQAPEILTADARQNSLSEEPLIFDTSTHSEDKQKDIGSIQTVLVEYEKETALQSKLNAIINAFLGSLKSSIEITDSQGLLPEESTESEKSESENQESGHSESESDKSDSREPDGLEALPVCEDAKAEDEVRDNDENQAIRSSWERYFSKHYRDNDSSVPVEDTRSKSKRTYHPVWMEMETEEILKLEDLDLIDFRQEDFSLESVGKLVDRIEKKLRNHKLIGADLLSVIGDEKAESMFFKAGDKALCNIQKAVSYSGEMKAGVNLPIAATTLVLAAMKSYDGGFYQHLPDYFPEFHRNEATNPVVQQTIRRIASEYSPNEVQQINFFIRQAVIPSYYLKQFLDFVYDLYAKQLRYALPENVEDLLQEAFLNLGKDDDNSVAPPSESIASSRQIKTVKELIRNNCWHSELVLFAKAALKWMDASYWQGKDADVYPGYFQKTFIQWKQSKLRLIRMNKVETRRRKNVIPKAQFLMTRKQILLQTPDIYLPDKFDFDNLELEIHKGNRVIASTTDLNLYRYGSRLMVEAKKIPVEDPLGQLHIILQNGQESLEVCEKSLFNTVLLFDAEGKGLSLNRKLPETVLCVFNSDAQTVNVELMEKTPFYSRGVMELEDSGPLSFALIDNYFISNHKNIDSLKVMGQTIPDYHIEFGSRIYPVYRKIESMIFLLKDLNLDDYILHINERSYRLRDCLKRADVQRIESQRIVSADEPDSQENSAVSVDLEDRIQPGFSRIQLEKISNLSITCQTDVFLDAAFNIYVTEVRHPESKDEKLYSAQIESDVINAEVEDPDERNQWDGYLDFESENLLEIHFSNHHFEGELVAVPPVNDAEETGLKVDDNNKEQNEVVTGFYRIDQKPWTPFSKSIFKNDLGANSKISIKGFVFDEAKIVDNNKILYLLPVISRNWNRWITVERLISDYSDIDQYQLYFYSQDQAIGWIDVLCKTKLLAFPEASMMNSNAALIQFTVEGPDPVHAEIRMDGKLICQKENLMGEVRLEVPVGSFRQDIQFEVKIAAGDEDDLFAASDPYVLYHQRITVPKYSPQTHERYSVLRIQLSELAEETINVQGRMDLWLEKTERVQKSGVLLFESDAPETTRTDKRLRKPNAPVKKGKKQIELEADFMEAVHQNRVRYLKFRIPYVWDLTNLKIRPEKEVWESQGVKWRRIQYLVVQKQQ